GARMSAPQREPAQALLLDLDGVVRVIDPEYMSTVEQRYGVAPGALARTGSEWDRLRPALVGEISLEEWQEGVAAALVHSAHGTLDAEGAASAVSAWVAEAGRVVPEVVDLIRTARSHGRPVALTVNGMSHVDKQVDALGLRDEVDAVVSST